MKLSFLDSVIELHAPPGIAARCAAAFACPSDQPATARVIVDPATQEVSWADGHHTYISEDHAVTLVAVLINRICLEQCTSLAFHAGAVARNGEVTAFPAASGVGKSTLTAALLSLGWQYVSDEALVLAASGHVRPYAKPLSLHDWSLNRLGMAPAAAGAGERLVSSTELGAGPAPEPLRLRHLVMVERGSTTWLARRPRPQGTSHLLRHSFNHYRDPQAAFRLTSSVVEQARCWSLTLADPVDAARLLCETLD